MTANKLAAVYGIDIAEAREAEYQPGQWSPRIWCTGDWYVAFTKGTRSPRVRSTRSDDEWTAAWEQVPTSSLHRPDLLASVTVWRCRS